MCVCVCVLEGVLWVSERITLLGIACTPAPVESRVADGVSCVSVWLLTVLQ